MTSWVGSNVGSQNNQSLMSSPDKKDQSKFEENYLPLIINSGNSILHDKVIKPKY